MEINESLLLFQTGTWMVFAWRNPIREKITYDRIAYEVENQVIEKAMQKLVRRFLANDILNNQVSSPQWSQSYPLSPFLFQSHYLF